MSSLLPFSQRYRRWLEKLGFIGDPFALHEADQERKHLPYLFVDRPYLHDIVGDPQYPKTGFLLAARGEGKTATREMVAYECTHRSFRHRALAIRYYDFIPVLEQVEGDATRVTARIHVQNIVRSLFKTLADEEEVSPTYFDLLKETEKALLLGFAQAFADPITQLKLGKLLNVEPLILQWEILSPVETMRSLTEIVTHLGQSPDTCYRSLYILVDRVDESSAGPEAAVPLLVPLIRERTLLEMDGLAFKFFLPLAVGEELRSVVDLRPDRLCLRTIRWNRSVLSRVISLRLKYYSEDNVMRLEDICTSATKSRVMDRLIEASEGSPRTLIRLCRSLFIHHVERTNETLIESQDVVDTLADFLQRLEVERTEASLVPESKVSVIGSAPSVPPEHGLFLDKSSGHVWVNQSRLTPPLSPQEFRLLTVLYSNAPDIVSKEELLKAIWDAETLDGPVYDEQNLRKLISRLRERLEPDIPGRQSSYVKSVRGRGYWLKKGIDENQE